MQEKFYAVFSRPVYYACSVTLNSQDRSKHQFYYKKVPKLNGTAIARLKMFDAVIP